MGDEVTRKDLQSLMSTFNAKLSDLDKKLAKEVGRLDAMDVLDHKVSVEVRTHVRKELAELWAAVKQLEGEVRKLASRVDRPGH